MARLKYFCVLEQQRTKLHHHPVSCSFLSLHPQQRLVRPACGPLVGRRPCFDAPECVLDLLHDPALAVGLKLVPVYQPIELLPQRGPVCEQGSDVGGRGGDGLCVRCCLFCFRSSPLCAGPTMLPVKRPRGNIPRIKIDRPRAWRSLRPPLQDILDVSHRSAPSLAPKFRYHPTQGNVRPIESLRGLLFGDVQSLVPLQVVTQLHVTHSHLLCSIGNALQAPGVDVVPQAAGSPFSLAALAHRSHRLSPPVCAARPLPLPPPDQRPTTRPAAPAPPRSEPASPARSSA